MFISQLNIPFKHKEWILNLHMNKKWYPSSIVCVITVSLVTTGIYYLTSKTKVIKNHATGFLTLLYD